MSAALFKQNLLSSMKNQRIYGLLHSVIHSAFARLVYPYYAELDDSSLISRSMIYIWLKQNNLEATAELLQAETYENLLTPEELQSFVDNYTDLRQYLLSVRPKPNVKIPRSPWPHREKSQQVSTNRGRTPVRVFAKDRPTSYNGSDKPFDRPSPIFKHSFSLISHDGRASTAPRQSLNDGLRSSMSNLQSLAKPKNKYEVNPFGSELSVKTTVRENYDSESQSSDTSEDLSTELWPLHSYDNTRTYQSLSSLPKLDLRSLDQVNSPRSISDVKDSNSGGFQTSSFSPSSITNESDKNCQMTPTSQTHESHEVLHRFAGKYDTFVEDSNNVQQFEKMSLNFDDVLPQVFHLR